MKHSKLVFLLSKSGRSIRNEMTCTDAHLMHMAIGICGEAGEIVDTVKKRVIYRQALDRENLIEELGDLEFYLEGLRQAIFATRQECLRGNVRKLTKRYEALSYSNKAAKDRADKKG